VPAIYQQSFSAVDPTNSGETSVNSLSRVLSTSSLPAATVDKVRQPIPPPQLSLPSSLPPSVAHPHVFPYHRLCCVVVISTGVGVM